MLPESVTAYLDAHRQEHLEKLKEFLAFPSVANVTAEPDPCEQCARWLAEHAGQLGFDAEVVPTDTKPAVLGELIVDEKLPTILVYGHYDVQPPEPLELWESGPFQAEVRDGNLYARGAEDNKGQLWTHLMAIDALRNTVGLPVNIKLFFEGEEEIGSPCAEAFLTKHKDRLKADYCVISDSQFFAADVPSIIYSLRGLTYFELTLTGPNQDLHSGLNGGAVGNPINALAKMIAAMHDENGRIMLPGFYDDVIPLTAEERATWESLPFDESEYAASMGLDALTGGEKGYSALERSWARPTLDCNGIVGGYTAEGSKTIIPSKAHAKISCRLVPNQDPEKIVQSVRAFIEEQTPEGFTVEMKVNAEARPVMIPTGSPAIEASRRAMDYAFEKETALIRCGASVPVTEVIQRVLGIDAVLMGFGLPDDNIHAPNEKFALDCLYRGSKASAAFMCSLPELM
ncbi:MAG: dipeptidase [Phycisphaerae bacterium]